MEVFIDGKWIKFNKEDLRQVKLNNGGIKYYLGDTKINLLKTKFPCKTCGKEIIREFGSSMSDECKACKQKNSMIKLYGVAGSTSLQKFKDSIKIKYGVDNVSQLSSVQDKIKQSSQKKWGVDNHFQSDETKEKIHIKEKTRVYSRILKLKTVTPLFSLDDFLQKKSKYDLFLWSCNKCKTNFEFYYANGTIPRCPICFPKLHGTSMEEKEIQLFIHSLLKEKILENTRKIIPPLELDIYIPSKNLAIEFDGLYHHSEINGEKDSSYHLDKTTRCQQLGIQLLHIFENEWIEKQDIVKSIIKSKLGLYEKILGARKCSIKEVSNQEASDFYDQNHIQGGINSKVNIGLFFNDELVSCISFSKPRYNKKYEWEITRFANLLNTTVHGSFGKLWNYFQKKYNPESMITYSDKRYFNGQVYKKYFTELPDSGPAYWYLDKNLKLHSRTEFQKYKLSKKLGIFDSNLTEWENMQLNGWDRIWDCGNKVFEWRN